VNNRSLDAIVVQEADDFGFGPLGMHIHNFLLVPGRSQKIGKDFPLRRIAGRIAHPMKVEADLA
jgi:hypothetical protein